MESRLVLSGLHLKLYDICSCLQYNMKLLRKNSPEKEEKAFVSNIIVTNDILKQCEKNVSFEDTSKFFIQSGMINDLHASNDSVQRLLVILCR